MFSIGYEFTDWDKNQLTAAPAQQGRSTALTFNHLYTNGLLFNLTWVG